MKHVSFILLLLFALSACKSVDKLYESGDYEQVISKLDGKAKRNNLDRRERSLLLKAANKYFESEKKKVLASSNSGHHKDWKNAKQKLRRLEKEANEISDYPQIRQDELDSNDFDGLIAELDQKLFDYTMDIYDAEIADYDLTGDRAYAIRAYGLVKDLDNYGASQKVIDSLYELAIYLGHRFIAVDFNSDVFNSWEFRNEFKNEIDFHNDDFNTFTDRVNEYTDYEISIAAEISGKNENTDRSYQNYSDRIVDYYETEMDTATNQKIETPVYKTIEASVKTIAYVWTVEGRAAYTVYDFRTNSRFDRGNFSTRVEDQGERHFHESGDEDAIPSNINLERFENFNYDFSDLIEACFEMLAEEFNDRVNITKKLL